MNVLVFNTMKNKVFVSVLSQGSLSVFNFILSILLIKELSFSVFGQYSLIFMLGLTSLSFQNSLISTPMSIQTKKRVQDGFSKYQQFYNVSNYIFMIMASVIGAAIAFFVGVNWLCVGLYLSMLTLREYIKNLLLINYQVAVSFAIDLTFVALSSVLLLTLYYYDLINLSNIFLALAVSLFLAILFFMNHVNLKAKISPLFFRFYRIKVWKLAKWATIGVLITECHSRAYIFILKAFYSLEILGLVQAARVIFGPLSLLVNGWIRIARNYLASMLGQKNYKKFNSFFYLSLLAFATFNAVMIIAVVMLWPFLEKQLFDNISYDMFGVVLAWGGVCAVIQIRMVFSTALQAHGVFKLQSYLNLIASIVTISSALIISTYYRWQLIPLSLMAGEGALLALSVYYYLKLRGEKSER